MSEFFHIILGDFTGVQLLGYLWFFIIGYIIFGLTEATGRDIQSPKTPEKWSWKFWFHDNWRRYLTTIMCTYVLFRFYTEVSGHPFGNFDAIALGLIGDGVAATMKQRVKMIGANREKLMQENTADMLKTEQNVEAVNLASSNKYAAEELKSEQDMTAASVKEENKVVADNLKTE